VEGLEEREKVVNKALKGKGRVKEASGPAKGGVDG
jgi:hypothetical protein